MGDSIYDFFLKLLKNHGDFADEQEANTYLDEYIEKSKIPKSDQDNFRKKFKIVNSKGGYVIKPILARSQNLELPSPRFNNVKYRVIKSFVSIDKFNFLLKPHFFLNKDVKQKITKAKEEIISSKTYPIVIVHNKKIIEGKYGIYALKELGYNKVYVFTLKDKENVLTEGGGEIIKYDLYQMILSQQNLLLNILASNKLNVDKALADFSSKLKRYNSNLLFLLEPNEEDEQTLYITDQKDVVYIYFPFQEYFSPNYNLSHEDIEIIKAKNPELLIPNILKNVDFYDQIVESVQVDKGSQDEKEELRQFLISLNDKFVNAAQKVYDEWEQNEDGMDEILGAGGICQDIAEDMVDIFHTNNKNPKFHAYSSGENYDFHVVMYAYLDPEYLQYDEEGNPENEVLFEVDIPYDNYESGGGFTWTKKKDIKFDDSMIVITDLSSYYENYIQNMND